PGSTPVGADFAAARVRRTTSLAHLMQVWLPVPVLLYQILLSHLLFRSTMSPSGLPALWVTVTMLLSLLCSMTMPKDPLPDAPACVMRFWSLVSLPPHLAEPQPSRMPVSPLPDVLLQSMIVLRDEPNSQIPYVALFAAPAVVIVPSSE